MKASTHLEPSGKSGVSDAAIYDTKTVTWTGNVAWRFASAAIRTSTVDGSATNLAGTDLTCSTNDSWSAILRARETILGSDKTLYDIEKINCAEKSILRSSGESFLYPMIHQRRKSRTSRKPTTSCGRKSRTSRIPTSKQA